MWLAACSKKDFSTSSSVRFIPRRSRIWPSSSFLGEISCCDSAFLFGASRNETWNTKALISWFKKGWESIFLSNLPSCSFHFPISPELFRTWKESTLRVSRALRFRTHRCLGQATNTSGSGDCGRFREKLSRIFGIHIWGQARSKMVRYGQIQSPFSFFFNSFWLA